MQRKIIGAVIGADVTGLAARALRSVGVPPLAAGIGGMIIGAAIARSGSRSRPMPRVRERDRLLQARDGRRNYRRSAAPGKVDQEA